MIMTKEKESPLKPGPGQEGTKENIAQVNITRAYLDVKSYLVSIFKNSFDASVERDLPVWDVLEDIRTGGEIRDRILNVRNIYQKEGKSKAYKKAKEKLPAITFGGTFGYRDKTNLIQPTGIIIADLDKLGDQTEPIFNKLVQDKYVCFIFRSPSGNGLKVGIWAEGIQDANDHKRLYLAVERYFKENYNLKIDPSCKDISRLCYFSYDPDLYINKDPLNFDVDEWILDEPDLEPDPPPDPADFKSSPPKEKYARKVLESCCDVIRQSQLGEQHYIRRDRSRLMGGYLNYIAEQEVYQALEQAVKASGAEDMQAAMKTVRDGLEHGKQRPLPIPDQDKLNYSQENADPEKVQSRAEQILRDREPCGPFDLSVLPYPIKDYVEQLCERTEADPIMVLTSVLGTISAMVGKRCFISESQYFSKLYPNIWTLSVASSGSFKTTALNHGCRIAWEQEKKVRNKVLELEQQKEELDPTKNKKQIKELDKEIRIAQAESAILPNRMSGEGLLELLSEGQAGLIPASELGEWLDNLAKTHNQGLKPLFTDLYDCPQQYGYKTKGGGYLIIQRPFISIVGFSTLEWVQSNVSLSDVGSGFFARFLLFYPPQNKVMPPALPRQQEPFDCTIENQIKYNLDMLLDDNPMELSVQAAEYFEQVHAGIYAALEQLDERDQALITPYTKRWSPYVLKLAMLFQAVTDPGTKINVESVQAGAAVVEYAIKSTVHLFRAELGESPFQRQCRAVLEYIAKQKGKTKRHKLIGSKILDGGSKDYDDILDTLEQQGQIIVTESPSKQRKHETIQLSEQTEFE